jgi:hypothetical protein
LGDGSGGAEHIKDCNGPAGEVGRREVGGQVDNRELQELPFTFRTQNTSPILAIQAIPEVQRAGQQFSLSGSLPYQNEVSVDGILTTSVRRNGIGAEGFNIFPSIESVQEIKVSSVTNTAEYAQLGDITTISRPGTNDFHGTAFWNFNETGLNANPNYFNKSVAPNKSENQNFGASMGGRLLRNRTFFFGTFERLDITRVESPGTTATVPSAAFRNGDFSAVSTAVIDPQTGQPFPGNRIPAGRINPVAAALLTTFFPKMVTAFSPGYVFLFFCGMMVLQFVWVQFMVPETKGRSLEEIQRDLGMS